MLVVLVDDVALYSHLAMFAGPADDQMSVTAAVSDMCGSVEINSAASRRKGWRRPSPSPSTQHAAPTALAVQSGRARRWHCRVLASQRVRQPRPRSAEHRHECVGRHGRRDCVVFSSMALLSTCAASAASRSAPSGRHGDGRLHHTGDHHTGDAACSTDGAGSRGSGMLIEVTGSCEVQDRIVRLRSALRQRGAAGAVRHRTA